MYNRYDNRRGRDDYRGRRYRSNSGDRNYRPRNNSGTRYPSNNNWDFQEYLKKLRRQITKIRGNGNRDKNADEEANDKAFIMHSVNSLLENTQD